MAACGGRDRDGGEMPGEKCLEFLAEFYADDGIITNREPERLHHSLDALVALFERVGLITNMEKTKDMAMIPGKIRTRLIEEIYANLIEGLGLRPVEAGEG